MKQIIPDMSAIPHNEECKNCLNRGFMVEMLRLYVAEIDEQITGIKDLLKEIPLTIQSTTGEVQSVKRTMLPWRRIWGRRLISLKRG